MRSPELPEFRRLVHAGVSPTVALALADPTGQGLDSVRRELTRLALVGVSSGVAGVLAEPAGQQLAARRRQRARAAQG